MQIHQLKGKKRDAKKRIGRGGKRGTTSGRGTKGQGAHGKKKPALYEGGRSSLVKRMKKLRGFKAVQPKKHTVSLDRIDRAFEAGSVVTLAALIEKGVVSDRALREGVKVVATGSLTKKLSLGEGITASKKAVEAFA